MGERKPILLFSMALKGQFLLAKGQASRAVFVLETRWLPGFLNIKIHDYVPQLSAIEAGTHDLRSSSTEEERCFFA